MNPLMMFNKVIQQYKIVQNNPQELGKILLNSGTISQEQYGAIKDMAPSQIGQYLMTNGMLGQNQVQQFGSIASQIQQMINNQ